MKAEIGALTKAQRTRVRQSNDTMLTLMTALVERDVARSVMFYTLAEAIAEATSIMGDHAPSSSDRLEREIAVYCCRHAA
jgi:hypothetical protein